MEPFSKRNKPAPTAYTYELSERSRNRLWQHMCSNLPVQQWEWGQIWEDMEERVLLEEGALAASGLRSEYYENVKIHFDNCKDEHVLDCLEYFFQAASHFAQVDGKVDAVNNVLRQEGIGYELTAFRYFDMIEYENGNLVLVESPAQYARYKIEYPQVIKKDGEYIHEQVIRPALEALQNPKLATANHELLDAHVSYRHDKYEETITKAGSALESVFKTILCEKGWAFNPDHALKGLVEACQDKLFPGFYGEIFKNTGTIRNKLGDAHGKAASPHSTTKEHADHVLQLVSAHINFLIKVAGL